MSIVRQRARDLLDAAVPVGRQITSNGSTAAQFTKLTGGVTHDTLVKNWETGGIMTACNAFVGWYAAQLGSKTYLGRFDLEKVLPDIGKGDAWVTSANGLRPQYGDILRYKSFHVDVALDFDGDLLNRVAAGQGGRSRGCDIICRVSGKGSYNFQNLQGWVDIERYFGAATVPNPSWLLGWWKVTWRGQAFYYHFDRGSQAGWTQAPPSHPSMPLNVPRDTGDITVEAPATVTIRWRASGSVEQMVRLPTKSATSQMAGTWNRTESLTAEKI